MEIEESTLTWQRTKGLLESCREGREEEQADSRHRGSDAVVLKVWDGTVTP